MSDKPPWLDDQTTAGETARTVGGCLGFLVLFFGGNFAIMAGTFALLAKFGQWWLVFAFPVAAMAWTTLISRLLGRDGRPGVRARLGALRSARPAHVAAGAAGAPVVVSRDAPLTAPAQATTPAGPRNEQRLVDHGDGMKGMLMLLAFSLFWNVFLIPFNWLFVFRPSEPVPLWVKGVIVLFDLIGLGLLAGVVNKGRILLAMAPGELVIRQWPARLGEPFAARYERRLRRYAVLTALTGQLACVEVVTYRRGTDRTTVRETVMTLPLTPKLTATSGTISAEFVIDLPASAPPSFKSRHNQIEWTVTLQPSLRGAPSDDSSFVITISPEVVRADA